MPNQYLKHKPPILILDKIVDVKPMDECLATVELNLEKWFFKCHYPDYPVMPASLLIEAMSQSATVLLHGSGEKNEIPLISEITRAVFKREVIPGVHLSIWSKLDSTNRGISKVRSECKIGDEVVCSCNFSIVMTSVMRQFIRREQV